MNGEPETTETAIPLHDLIGQFNAIFHDTAKAQIVGGVFSITIGNRTMRVQLPILFGVESTGSSG